LKQNSFNKKTIKDKDCLEIKEDFCSKFHELARMIREISGNLGKIPYDGNVPANFSNQFFASTKFVLHKAEK
jgi:hypothetical protein